MYGFLKIYVEVYYPTGLPHNSAIVKRKLVHNETCTDADAQGQADKFMRANKHIPVAAATWTAEPKSLDVHRPVAEGVKAR